MSKKKIVIFLAIIALFIIVLTVLVNLWVKGIIPMQIARLSATAYFNIKYPKAEMKFEDIEWASVFNDYLIYFRDKENKRWGFTIGPRYFPVSLGQGLFGFEEEYNEKYSK